MTEQQPDKKISYRFHVLRWDGSRTRMVAEMSDPPTLAELREVVMPHLAGADHFEHVAVLHWERRCDMFVDECGALNGRPRNEAATEIYRNNWMRQHPEQDPESLPLIAGPAVLFEQIVWT